MSKPSVTRMACARIPTEYGDFQLCYYTNSLDTKEHLALTMGDVAKAWPVLVRVHSECFTGDVLGSRRCDCGEQLERSLQMVAREGLGVVLYMRQEGRGIGLLEKLRAYNLQDQGYDTVDANLMLGHEADERDYTLAACMLKELGVKSVRLMTNNPSKIAALKDEGIDVVERVPLEIQANTDNASYLLTKVRRMDHQLRVNPLAAANSEPHEPQSTN
ncbi:MAG TPA: GTP cyclohydrolase II [Candidatus Acidoferrum sp.]|nr:GTP cyclohydrolase II [Candidatus Acidoferrum sp.]